MTLLDVNDDDESRAGSDTTLRDAPGRIAELPVEWVTPVQEFLMLALGHRPGLTRIGMECDEDSEHPIWVEMRPPWPRIGPTGAAPRLIRYLRETRTLLLPDDDLLTLESALTAWFHKQAELRVVVSMLSSGLRDPHVAIEHRFLSLFLAMDALARQSGNVDSQALSKVEHGARVDAIAEAMRVADLPDQVQEWATSRLQAGNSKSQTAVLTEFLVLTGLFTDENAASIAKRLNVYRTDIAHRGVIHNVDQDDVVLDVINLADLLEWIVRAEILSRLGIDRASIRDRLTSNTIFQRAIELRTWRKML